MLPAVAPVCKEDQITSYGAAPHDDVEISCEVEANPSPSSFKWTYNSSGDTIGFDEVIFIHHNSY